MYDRVQGCWIRTSDTNWTSAKRGVFWLIERKSCYQVLPFSVLALVVALVAIASIALAQDSITINGDDDLTTENGVTRGKGTAADPYVIEGLNITGTESYCIFMNYTEKHVVIQDMNLSQWNKTYTGIRLEYASNLTVYNLTFFNLTIALEARWCTNISVEDVTLYRGRIEFSWSNGIRVDWLEYRLHYPGSTQPTIDIYESTHASISNCNFVGSETSIRLSNVEHVKLLNNTMRDVRYGITSNADYLDFNVDVVIEGNTIHNFSSTAINLVYVNGLGMANNTITGEGYFYSISVYGKNLWYIRDNTMGHGGIYLGYRFPEEVVWDFRNNLLAGREIYYFSNQSGMDIPTDSHQVILANCSDCSITGPFSGPYRPWFTVNACSNITVKDFSFSGGELSHFLASLNDNFTVEDCSFSAYRYGLWIADSKDVTVRRCIFTNCTNGLLLDDCRRSRVYQCQFTGCIAGIGDTYVSLSRPGDFLFIENNTFQDISYAIIFESLSHASIVNNTFTNITSQGIFIDYDDMDNPNTNVTIAENTFLDCVIAMELRNMDRMYVRGNSIEGSETAIRIPWIEGGTISWNIISNCSDHGIDISWAEDLVITANVISDCERYAILLWSTGVKVYLNDFIDNYENGTAQVYARYESKWNFNQLGNYWSDYQERYPDATNNGIVWSEPYEVGYPGTDIFDNYPLVHRFDLEPPVADAGGNQTVDEGAHVTLDGTGSRDNRGIVRYEWTFYYERQPRTLMGPTVGFTFVIPGVYRIELTVADPFGNQGTDIAWITVLDALPPTADAGPDVYAEQFTNTTLDGSASHDTGGIANFTWSVELPVGTLLLYGELPTLYCEHAGEFNITLRVTDNAGHWAEDTTSLIVVDREPPVADIDGEHVVDQWETVHLDASRCTDNVGIVSYAWRLEDAGGTVRLQGVRVEHTWEEAGEYLCSLVLRDAKDNEATARFTVRVLDIEPPEMDDPVDQEAAIRIPFRFPNVEATDNVGVVDIVRTFVYSGVEIILHGAEPEFTFDIAGTYNVTITAVDAANNSVSRSFRLVVIDPEKPIAVAGPDQVVDSGDLVTLSGIASSDNEGITRYLWTFEHDGARELEGATVTFTFTVVGVHEVVLTVWDASGNSASDSMLVTVLDNVPPVASLVVPTTAMVGETVALDGRGSSDNVGIVNWTWTFEHNGTTVELYGEESSFVFEVPGTYTIHLAVRDAAGLRNETTMVLEITEPSDGDGDGGDKGTGLGAIVAIILVVLIIGIGLLLWSRRGGGERPPTRLGRQEPPRSEEEWVVSDTQWEETVDTGEWEEF